MNAATKRKRPEAAHTESESEEEDFDFENVDLGEIAGSSGALFSNHANSATEISISINPAAPEEPRKRYPTTAIARKIRLEIHKVHLLCLLSHAALRNKWCDDQEVRNALATLKKDFRGNLHPKTTSAQIQRTRVLLEGLELVSDYWSKSFKVTQGGLHKSKWYAEEDLKKFNDALPSLGRTISLEEFRQAARHLTGDRDVGTQLFVVLLRMLGLDVRLVCSLQPLGLSAGKPNLASIVEHVMHSDAPTDATTSPQQLQVTRARNLTKPRLGISRPVAASVRPKPKAVVSIPVNQSSYPIFWAEVFDSAAQKWYSVDPLVTGGVNKPNAFEPPQSDFGNTLSYVVAFNADGSAKDVTQRYTKQFNAKVRKTRVESVSASGAAWWASIMRFYARIAQADRDAIEEGDFAQRVLSEGIPTNMSDLKHHPVFVIERHLRKNEILQPRRPCGTVTVGKARPPVVENVYPRKDVQSLKSSLTWHMRGRRVRIGEQPLKMLPKRTGRLDGGTGESQDVEQEGYFAEAQTEINVPPPVMDGRVPKNEYGNIDFFVPSMLPAGAIHVPHLDAERAAQILGIDYAVAVTGFDYANRMVVAIKQGVIVAAEYHESMQVVQLALREETEFAAGRTKTLAALQRWSHFLRSLRIHQHVQTQYGTAREEEEEEEERDTGAGFM